MLTVYEWTGLSRLLPYGILHTKGSSDNLQEMEVTVSDLSVLSLRGLTNHYDANPVRDFNISAQGREACGPDKAGSPALK